MKVREVMQPIEGLPADAVEVTIDLTGECNHQNGRSADEIMESLIGFCFEGEKLASAMKKLDYYRRTRLLVRDATARVVGIISMEELLAAAPELRISCDGDGQ